MPLRLSAEHSYPVDPLPVPGFDSASAERPVGDSDAVALFVERAQSVAPGFALTPQNERAIAEICVALDGLPLAIELAAALIEVLPPDELCKRLDHRLNVLTGGARDPPPGTAADTANRDHVELRALDRARAGLFRRSRRLRSRLDAPSRPGRLAHAGRSGSGDVRGAFRSRREEPDPFRPGIRRRAPVLDARDDSGVRRGAPCREWRRRSLGKAHSVHYTEAAEHALAEVDGVNQRASLESVERDQANFAAALEWAITEDSELALRLVAALGPFLVLARSIHRGQKTH